MKISFKSYTWDELPLSMIHVVLPGLSTMSAMFHWFCVLHLREVYNHAILHCFLNNFRPFESVMKCNNVYFNYFSCTVYMCWELGLSLLKPTFRVCVVPHFAMWAKFAFFLIIFVSVPFLGFSEFSEPSMWRLYSSVRFLGMKVGINSV